MTKKTKNRRSQAKTEAWFTPIRGSYLPASAAGWWTYLPFVAYLICSVIVGIKDTSSAAVAILFIVPNWIAAAVVVTYIAARKS
jgi:hypothetical protein